MLARWVRMVVSQLAPRSSGWNCHFNVAVAEKAAALRTEAYFRERAGRADLSAFDRILAKGGTEPPRPGAELPNDRTDEPESASLGT